MRRFCILKSIILILLLYIVNISGSSSVSFAQVQVHPGPPPYGPPPYMPPCPVDEQFHHQTCPPVRHTAPVPYIRQVSAVVDMNVNVYELMRRERSLDRFTQLLDISGMREVLSGDGSFTVFAPVNESFHRYPQSMVWEMARPENAERLRNMMSHHIISGASITPGQLLTYRQLRTIDGHLVQVRIREDRVYINDAEIIGYQMTGSNGVVYLIDTPLIPGNGQRRAQDYMQETDL
jgi:uncharacterized surface protein with fasciclin (FAS1) repeats